MEVEMELDLVHVFRNEGGFGGVKDGDGKRGKAGLESACVEECYGSCKGISDGVDVMERGNGRRWSVEVEENGDEDEGGDRVCMCCGMNGYDCRME